MATIINASTSAGLIQTADTSGTLQLQSNGVTQQTVDSTGSYGQLKQGTVNAGGANPFNNTLTSVDFTGIPSWAKRITVMFSGVSTSGTNNIQIQLGTGSTPTYTTSGYVGVASSAGGSGTAFSAGFLLSDTTVAAQNYSGLTTICNITGNTWAENSIISPSASAQSGSRVGGGYVSLAATITAVRITTANGTDTFDAGSINILYEG